MTEINPFEQYPLYAWENCITHDEIVDTLTIYIEMRLKTPWWNVWKKIQTNMAISILGSLDEHIHKKQKIAGGQQ
jgi:hypothetical protein